jgi:hypothetical protein
MRKYRQHRVVELHKAKDTLTALDNKHTYYQDQADTYNLYIQGCLQNLAPSKAK